MVKKVPTTPYYRSQSKREPKTCCVWRCFAFWNPFDPRPPLPLRYQNEECDINPLIASAESILSLDARVLLHDSSVSTAELPQPSIRPYPHHYVSWTLEGLVFSGILWVFWRVLGETPGTCFAGEKWIILEPILFLVFLFGHHGWPLFKGLMICVSFANPKSSASSQAHGSPYFKI